MSFEEYKLIECATKLAIERIISKESDDIFKPPVFKRYLSEPTRRYNHREMVKGDRLNALLRHVDGSLRYKELIA